MKETSKKQQIHEISLRNIVQDKDVQPRKEMDLDVAREYSEAMLAGDIFPPIVLYFDGVTYWLADGFYRVRAAIAANLKSIKAIVYSGGKEDAILHSVGANASHGLRRTNADKRNAIFKMLNHPEWSLWSDKAIADKCHVSAGTVSKLRHGSPGVIGHDVDIRVNAEGNLFTRPNGSKKETVEEEIAPEPRFTVPPRALTKQELGEQYMAKVARHLRKADPKLRRGPIETPIGIADLADSERCYFFATAHDRHTMYSAIGRALLVSTHLQLKPVIVGHFPKMLTPLINAAERIGTFIMSPEALIKEVEV